MSNKNQPHISSIKFLKNRDFFIVVRRLHLLKALWNCLPRLHHLFPSGKPPVWPAGGHLVTVGCLLSCDGGGHPAVWAGVPVAGSAEFGWFLLPIRILVIIPFFGPSSSSG